MGAKHGYGITPVRNDNVDVIPSLHAELQMKNVCAFDRLRNTGPLPSIGRNPAQNDASAECGFAIWASPGQRCTKCQNFPSQQPHSLRNFRCADPAAGQTSRGWSPLTPWRAWRFQRASLQIANRPKTLDGAKERRWCHQLHFRRACQSAASGSQRWA